MNEVSEGISVGGLHPPAFSLQSADMRQELRTEAEANFKRGCGLKETATLETFGEQAGVSTREARSHVPRLP
jgi:hypothetical protein